MDYPALFTTIYVVRAWLEMQDRKQACQPDAPPAVWNTTSDAGLVWLLFAILSSNTRPLDSRVADSFNDAAPLLAVHPIHLSTIYTDALSDRVDDARRSSVWPERGRT